MRTGRRYRRQAVKEGRCPSWSVIRNCSSLEQCNWDSDCSGTQKCCRSTCETRSCYEPIFAIGPGEGTFSGSVIARLCENSDAKIAYPQTGLVSGLIPFTVLFLSWFSVIPRVILIMTWVAYMFWWRMKIRTVCVSERKTKAYHWGGGRGEVGNSLNLHLYYC